MYDMDIALVSGTVWGAMAASKYNIVVQTVVSGVVAGASDIASQVKSIKNGQQTKMNWMQVGVSIGVGVFSGIIGGDGIRNKNGDIAKAKNLYDNFIDCVKNRTWNARNASGKISILAKNYRKTVVKCVKEATGYYTFGTASGYFAKKIFESLQHNKRK